MSNTTQKLLFCLFPLSTCLSSALAQQIYCQATHLTLAVSRVCITFQLVANGNRTETIKGMPLSGHVHICGYYHTDG